MWRSIWVSGHTKIIVLFLGFINRTVFGGWPLLVAKDMALANPLFALSFNFVSRLHSLLVPIHFFISSRGWPAKAAEPGTARRQRGCRLRSFIINGALLFVGGWRGSRGGCRITVQTNDFIKSKGKHSQKLWVGGGGAILVCSTWPRWG